MSDLTDKQRAFLDEMTADMIEKRAKDIAVSMRHLSQDQWCEYITLLLVEEIDNQGRTKEALKLFDVDV